MKSTSLCISALVLSFAGCSSTTKTNKPDAASPAPNISTKAFLSPPRQLTFAGARAGEGYFSRDGRYMVFQSEREANNPFYQIYLMDLNSGSTQRISPGQGKTTCAWIHPSNKYVIFSSTHEDKQVIEKTKAEWEERKQPKKRYSWSFDDSYDIYRSDLKGKKLVNLTKSKGYDAEASYSPDGEWIVFASNRKAYSDQMSAAEKAAFERDPSFMMDLYIMKADGTQVRQLTQAPGYDGGPFFSPDGSRITFRRFNTDGRTADIYTIGVDGKDEKRLTDFKSISWAPFYHPSGDYIIFASNKFGHANFELFIVDSQGRHAPVRVSDSEGFDGLPVFTPDAGHLVWSKATEKGDAQLFISAWNDKLAREALNLPPTTPNVRELKPEIRSADAKAWVEYLSHSRFLGRMSGGETEPQYTQTLANAFRDMGLKPIDGSFFQNYEFTSGIDLGSENSVALESAGKIWRPKLNADWIPLSYSKTGKFNSAPLVFAGYGIVAPAAGDQPAYDSFAGTDIKGKWVMVFSGVPENVSSQRRFHLHMYSRLQHKATVARQRGALGLIFIDDTETPSSPLRLKFEGRGEDAGLPVLRFSNHWIDNLLKSVGQSRRDWTKKLASGEVFSSNLESMSIQADIDLQLKRSKTRNVVAMLPAQGAKSNLVIGAHLDHLGMGEGGNSLSSQPGIHPGADDNASGVAGVLEIAHAMSEAVRSGKLKLTQNVIFGLWTAEEIGILGSAHFLNTIKSPTLAYLNLDMIGRYDKQLLIQGTGSAKEWAHLLEKSALTSNLIIKTQSDPYTPSDSLAFYMRGIPSLMFFTGAHPEYHTPADVADLINYDGITEVAGLVYDLGITLAKTNPSPVTYQKADGALHPLGSPGRGFRLYLGTIPDYTRESLKGVAISGTSKDSPAEKAGLQPGDIILQLGGIEIRNIQDYVYCLQALKANEKTKMRVLRAGREQEIEITPVLKTQQ